VKGKEPFWQPKTEVRTSSFSSEVFKGAIMEFLKFTLSPVEAENVFRISLRWDTCKGQAAMIKSVSSAYCTIGKSKVADVWRGRLINPCSLALLITD
jgi:hypothetical protein